MKRPFILAFFLIALFMLIIGLIGCAVNPTKPSPTAPVGTAIDKASAYNKSADAAVAAAVPHTDSAGKEDLTLAASAHKSVEQSLQEARASLAATQKAYDAQTVTISNLTAQLAALNNSWGHKLQVFVQAFLTIILILVAIHFVFGVLGMVLPPPYSMIASLVAKIVNPFGWFTWLIARVEANVAKNVITTPASPVTIKTVAGTLVSGIAKL